MHINGFGSMLVCQRHPVVNGNIRMLINRGRGYKNLRYLLLKAKRMAVMNVEFITFRRIEKVA
jgi:hypothetical protein